MSLIIEGRAAFVHVPKCAGSWVRNVVKNGGLRTREIGKRHWTATAVRKAHPKLFIFATVRHPREWIRSAWCYGMRKIEAKSGRVGPLWRNRVPFLHDFEKFVEAYLKICPGYIGEFFEKWTKDADLVLKCESISGHIRSALHKAGLETGKKFEKAVRLTAEAKVCGRLPEWKERSRFTPQLETDFLHAEREALRRYGYAEACC